MGIWRLFQCRFALLEKSWGHFLLDRLKLVCEMSLRCVFPLCSKRSFSCWAKIAAGSSTGALVFVFACWLAGWHDPRRGALDDSDPVIFWCFFFRLFTFSVVCLYCFYCVRLSFYFRSEGATLSSIFFLDSGFQLLICLSSTWSSESSTGLVYSAIGLRLLVVFFASTLSFELYWHFRLLRFYRCFRFLLNNFFYLLVVPFVVKLVQLQQAFQQLQQASTLQQLQQLQQAFNASTVCQTASNSCNGFNSFRLFYWWWFWCCFFCSLFQLLPASDDSANNMFLVVRLLLLSMFDANFFFFVATRATRADVSGVVVIAIFIAFCYGFLSSSSKQHLLALLF